MLFLQYGVRVVDRVLTHGEVRPYARSYDGAASGGNDQPRSWAREHRFEARRPPCIAAIRI